MRAHVLQHVPYEGLGLLEPALRQRRFSTSWTRLFADDPWPEAADLDLVITLGGPMGANDEVECPWLIDEKHWLESVLQNDVPFLGICLGAQLMANVLGADVHRNPVPEIGWLPISPPAGLAANHPEAYRFPTRLEVLHLHSDTFDIPAGAIHLAESAACQNQAFQFGQRCFGLQFHLEGNPELIRNIEAADNNPTPPSDTVQSWSEILVEYPGRSAQLEAELDRLLDRLLQGSGA